MKRSFCLVLVLLTISCAEEHALTFVPVEYHGETCEECPVIEVNIPEAVSDDSVSASINASLREVAIATLSLVEEGDANTIGEAIEQFRAQYEDLKEDYQQAAPWETTVDGEVSYKSDRVISVRMESYSFTGGAHGYGATSFVNFDAKTGEQLQVEALFKDAKGFASHCEELFRKQEGIPVDENINATGFFFEGDTFHLPENIGFTEKGLLLVYNAYEIASYADGQRRLEVIYEDADPFLTKR